VVAFSSENRKSTFPENALIFGNDPREQQADYREENMKTAFLASAIVLAATPTLADDAPRF